MKKYNSLIFLSLLLSLFVLNNCTLIGLGVGSMIDANKSDEHYTIKEELFEISPETEIQVITITNDTLIGLYKSTTNVYSNDYIVEYNKEYDDIKEQFLIPEIDDTLTISNPAGNIYKYVFLGFDYNKIYVKSTLSDNKSFIHLNSATKFKLYNEQYLDQNRVNNGIEFKVIPIMSKIVLENKNEIHSSFYHQIQKIETFDKNTNIWFTIIGAAIDYYIIRYVILVRGFGG